MNKRLYWLLLIVLNVLSLHGHAQENEDGFTPVSIRTVPDSVVDELKQQEEFLYANDPAYWKARQPQKASPFLRWLLSMGDSRWPLYIFYGLLASLLLLVIYRLFIINRFILFRKSANTRTASEPANIETGDGNYQNQLKAAQERGDFRSAVRILYLQTLDGLRKKNQISFSQHATNRDYIRQMQHQRGSGEFQELTRIYEFVWYGSYHPDEQQYSSILPRFQKFMKDR